MLKLSFKTEIIISFLPERGNEEIFGMEQNLDMSEIKPSVETSRVKHIYAMISKSRLKKHFQVFVFVLFVQF